MNSDLQAFVPNLWTTLGGVYRLDASSFINGLTLKDSALVAIAIVLAAGLSQAVGQSIVLFANQVKPARFVFSLAISALLFGFGYAFLTVSTWALSWFTGADHVTLGALWIVLALAYAPLLFSFFEAIPYAGIPIMWLLRVWQLLATLVGVSALAHVSVIGALAYVGLGWLGLVIAHQTFGKPIAQLGVKLMDAVSGVKLEGDEDVAIERAQSSLVESASRSNVGEDGGSPSDPLGAEPEPPTSARAGHAPPISQISARKPSSGLRTIISVLAVIALFMVVLIAVRPLHSLLLGWYDHLPAVLRLPFNLVWIAIVAIIVAALLAPLETLGWWAGWYGDEIKPPPALAPRSGARGSRKANRYVIYLDGIAQSSSRYTPDVEAFLDALAPTLPRRVRFIRGLMVYSVFNRPLDDDPIFSGFWALVDKLRFANPASLLGLFVNIRNMLIVAVSTDPRYGPIYNFGIAKLLFEGLLANGYEPGSATPVTLIGYSGGAQMSAGCANWLRRALEAPIDLITLGGVMSGSGRFLDLEHIYDLVGDKDGIQKLGPLLFPSRWKIFPLTYWNRALRLGRISRISLGPVGHMEPGGMFDAKATLPDGRTHLQQTLDDISRILRGRFTPPGPQPPKKKTNYGAYILEPWNRPGYHPIGAAVDVSRYHPVAQWTGRLILPRREERDDVCGAWFEVYQADGAHAYLVGKTVKLRWQDDPDVRQRVRSATRDVFFSAEAEHSSVYGGTVCPTRLNHWRLVDPLESLAGSRPLDDVVVMLVGRIEVEDGDDPVVRIAREPVQIGGHYYGLVSFVAPESGDRYRVAHFNRTSGAFDGPQETIALPPAARNPEGRAPSSMLAIEQSALNADGWYVYGAPDASGSFAVRSLAPRAQLRAQAHSEIAGRKAAYRHVRKQAWVDLTDRKGTATSTLLQDGVAAATSTNARWSENDAALVIHVFGGVGGQQAEAPAKGPVYLGHFAYGQARVVRDPLADELRFEITYYQVYAHNEDGLVSGAQHWSRYMGDRQFGWLGERPVCDILVRHDGFTSDFELDPNRRTSALEALTLQLEVMAARYRIGDGTGCAFVGPANNCAQDSNRALFATFRNLRRLVENNPAFDAWAARYPDQLPRYGRLERLTRDLARKLQTFGGPRRDWTTNEFNLGSTMEDHPLQQVWLGLGSWRMALPRFASDTIIKTFLWNDASAWVLFYDQVGGKHPEIEPIAPLTL
jgi:predicted Abi (CAAX) family protease